MTPKHHTYSPEFIASYGGRTPPWGPLGFIVFQRTYARWLPRLNRKETWTECVQRVLEGNYNLVPDDPTITKQDMETAFDHMWNMRWMPAGRGLWISGTKISKTVSSALVNCWGINLEPGAYTPSDPEAPLRASRPFVFAMDKLLLGGGVGTNATKEVVAKFPKVRNKVSLSVVCDPMHENFAEIKAEQIPPREGSHTYLRLADTRRGWTDAARVVIDAHFKRTDYDYNLIIDVSDIRPRGRRIKGFGGTASGPLPLVEYLRSINALLNAAHGRKITPIEAADMVGYSAKCVVAGNIRRSALIHLFSADDEEARNSKLDMEKLSEVRWTANISIAVDDAYDNYEEIVEAIVTNGEPGIVNLERLQNYGRFSDGEQIGIDHEVSTVNPCAEIGLSGTRGEPCNLVEIFPYFIDTGGASFEEIALIAYRYAKRVTCGDFSDWESSADVISDNRRLGIGLSGWEDWKALLASTGTTVEERQQRLTAIYTAIAEEDVRYSALIGVTQSIKCTTMKPSGSVSKMNGSSAGRHPHYAPYIIQRIRFAERDPLIEVLRDAGYPMEADLMSPNTLCVEFPVKAPTADLPEFKSATDYTLEQHMQDQFELQEFWSDNSVSSTLTFLPEEAALIPDLLRKYKLKSTSLLPFSDHTYQQAPWEAISKEEYERRNSAIKFRPTEEHLLRELRDIELIGGEECEGGACPVK